MPRFDGRTRRPAIAPAMLFVAAAALALVTAPPALMAQAGLALGDTAPPVVLETLDGQEFDLGSVLGKGPVLIEFWATWCAVCRALEPEMNAAYEAYGDRAEFLIVAAAVAQTRDQIRRHLQRSPAPGRVLWDTRGRFTRAFDAPGTGYVVIVDRAGTVVYTGTSGDQDLSSALARILGDT